MSIVIDTQTCFSVATRDSILSELADHIDESVAAAQQNVENLQTSRTLIEMMTACIANTGNSSIKLGRVQNWRTVILLMLDENKPVGELWNSAFVDVFDRLEWAIDPSRIYKLVYLSHAARPMSEDDLLEIMEVSRRNNRKLAITGLLLYYNQSIVQILEGREADVEKLYVKIRKDPRHKDCVKLFGEAKSYRDFPNWTMGYERLEENKVSPSMLAFNTMMQGDALQQSQLETLSTEVRELITAFRDSAQNQGALKAA